MAKRCKAELEGLGFAVRFDDSAERTGSDTGNLIAFRAGSAAGAVALCGHMDTVRPCKGIEPVVEDGVICSAGGYHPLCRRQGWCGRHLRGRSQPHRSG